MTQLISREPLIVCLDSIALTACCLLANAGNPLTLASWWTNLICVPRREKKGAGTVSFFVVFVVIQLKPVYQMGS